MMNQVIIPLTPDGALSLADGGTRFFYNAKTYTLPDVPKEKVALQKIVHTDFEKWQEDTPPPESKYENVIQTVTEEINAYTFYCDSVAWDDSAFDDTAKFDDILPSMQTDGDGTIEKPWHNVLFALRQINRYMSCYNNAVCPSCRKEYFQLKVSGIVDYKIRWYGSRQERWQPDDRFILADCNFTSRDSFAGSAFELDAIYLNCSATLNNPTGKCYGFYPTNGASLCINCRVDVTASADDPQVTAFADKSHTIHCIACKANFQGCHAATGFADAISVGCEAFAKGAVDFFGFGGSYERKYKDCKVMSEDNEYTSGFSGDFAYLCAVEVKHSDPSNDAHAVCFNALSVAGKCNATANGMGEVYGFDNMDNEALLFECDIKITASVESTCFDGGAGDNCKLFNCTATVEGTPQATHVYAYGFVGFSEALFDSCNASISVTATENTSYVTIYGFRDNNDSIFNNCTGTVNVNGNLDNCDYSGCGFAGNDNAVYHSCTGNRVSADPDSSYPECDEIN